MSLQATTTQPTVVILEVQLHLRVARLHLHFLMSRPKPTILVCYYVTCVSLLAILTVSRLQKSATAWSRISMSNKNFAGLSRALRPQSGELDDVNYIKVISEGPMRARTDGEHDEHTELRLRHNDRA